MKSRHLKTLIAAALTMALWGMATPALATQTHGQPEGLYVHQIAHLFFIISMGILEFWLRQRNLVREPGWKYIQLAAVLLILWNLNAMAVHFLDEQIHWLQVNRTEQWHLHIALQDGGRALPWVYYILKLDHLLCVPAMICLYLGLKSLLKQTEAEKEPANLS